MALCHHYVPNENSAFEVLGTCSVHGIVWQEVGRGSVHLQVTRAFAEDLCAFWQAELGKVLMTLLLDITTAKLKSLSQNG